MAVETRSGIRMERDLLGSEIVSNRRVRRWRWVALLLSAEAIFGGLSQVERWCFRVGKMVLLPRS